MFIKCLYVFYLYLLHAHLLLLCFSLPICQWLGRFKYFNLNKLTLSLHVMYVKRKLYNNSKNYKVKFKFLMPIFQGDINLVCLNQIIYSLIRQYCITKSIFNLFFEICPFLKRSISLDFSLFCDRHLKDAA